MCWEQGVNTNVASSTPRPCARLSPVPVLGVPGGMDPGQKAQGAAECPDQGSEDAAWPRGEWAGRPCRRGHSACWKDRSSKDRWPVQCRVRWEGAGGPRAEDSTERLGAGKTVEARGAGESAEAWPQPPRGSAALCSALSSFRLAWVTAVSREPVPLYLT